jgi:ubiquinone/menaquinone biosynthesis C-methylase UbiE
VSTQSLDQEELDRVYHRRFSDDEARKKAELWVEIVAYLNRFVPPGAVVLDIACDRGDFIRNVSAGERWASDLRDMTEYLPPDVNFVQADGLELADRVPNGYFDLVFMSNYLEHLPSGEAVVAQLDVARRLLKPGGRVLVLQPNIRFVGAAYWDFIDHKVALTEKSLVEAGELVGLETEKLIKRFLPYTTKSALPQSRRLVRTYLALSPAWRILGKQTLYLARRA